MSKNQKKAFINVFIVFVVLVAVVANLAEFFDEFDKVQASIFGGFVAIFAIPIYFWVKTNSAYIDRIYEKDEKKGS